jgi:predicted pyridoxine 5'-phosphate oxidase superfamily flavin-nucleotide-binding protein
MQHRFFSTAFTHSVQAEQARHGSQAAYARLAAAVDPEEADGLTPTEISFVSARDSFYLGTVSETGWPHVQHRGGPAGFVHVLDARTLAWADFSGNRQYVSIGNTAVNDKVALIFVDYPARQRLKILGRMTTAEIGDRPDLRAQLEMAGYRAKIEHAIQVRVEAFDWNCPQHIEPRFSLSEIQGLIEPLQKRIADLEKQVRNQASGRESPKNK